MSSKMVNSFKCFNKSTVVGLKLINDLTEQNRIIVCGKNEVSIRNSVDGSLLHTLESDGMRSEFVGLGLYSKNIIVYANIKNGRYHRSFVYDENVSFLSIHLSHLVSNQTLFLTIRSVISPIIFITNLSSN